MPHYKKRCTWLTSFVQTLQLSQTAEILYNIVEFKKELIMTFFDNDLLNTEYLRRLKKVENPHRSYQTLIDSLESIHECNQQHAASFTKRIKSQQNDIRTCDSVFTEVIVYAYYLKLVYERIIKSLNMAEKDYDLRIELSDGSFHYLEIFSIMPNLNISTRDNIIVNDVKTHLHLELSSVRQKLLHKINKQKQLSKPRENFAVIELNDISIAGDFSILSSLSDGYKIKIDKRTMKIIDEGFDWSNSIFDNAIVEHLKGIIYFSLGNYNKRKFIFNPNFKKAGPTTVTY